MAQHFLLSPAARTLSLAKVLRMSDSQAEEAFSAIRWHETDGKPVCPECGGTEHYDLKSRPVWKCKACAKQFSLTSGTIFHSRKLKLRDILGAIAIFTNGAKGYSALQLSRDLGSGPINFRIPKALQIRFKGLAGGTCHDRFALAF